MSCYYVIGLPCDNKNSVLSRVVKARGEAFRLAREWRAGGCSVRVLERDWNTGLYRGVPEEVWQRVEVHEDDGYPD